MTIFKILKSDHQEIADLLGKLDKTTETQKEKRKELFEKFKAVMVVHARSEEMAVYELLKEKEKTRDLTFESFEEHHLVDHLIEQLSHLSPAQETWTAKMTVLKEMIEHHVEEEEGPLFKKMKSACSSEELATMADSMSEYKRTKSFLKQRPKQNVPKQVDQMSQ